ncbi:sulfate adenylyltransferase subunit 1 [Pontibacter ramchanderi]|uniref:sulfate adenylyltransferase n=1 Tax=Pontibacter ramchanderi TaxID=1179743 RepID=A0A2N3V0W6_9BACT|nr:GTP-binding protein [Pontibacter ramchanderi]PKV75274.1 sulfate adenylyltransferase subunit 1 [Pontibacter ramchanderi]
MDVLKIATAGSVDDGKSTLIGRLLFETNSITTDKLEAIMASSKKKGLDYVDLSLLTDGLIAEREQGITIDVAHIYFSTPKRKFIIADTPGHFEYTRNMVTGASNANVSMILVDARNGVVEQTFRHFYISCLLRIPNVVVCVNKMDLVGYAETTFEEIKAEFLAFAEKVRFPGQEISFIPVSSLYGENLVKTSEHMPWYTAAPLLTLLENVPLEQHLSEEAGRFPVQYVVRPKSEEFHDYRAYAGKVASGLLRKGERIMVLPSGQETTIARIEKFGREIEAAQAKESISLLLQDDVDISRGDMIVPISQLPQQGRQLDATICWMDKKPLRVGGTYLLQHGVNTAKAKVSALSNLVDVVTLGTDTEVAELKLNEIADVQLRTAKELFYDSFAENKANGAFIVIDEQTNSTVGVGLIK